MDPIFQEESARLSWTKEQYLQAAEDERLMLSALPRLYPNDPNLLNELLLHTHNRIVRLEQSRRKPYFARIDFTDGSSAQTDRCYIGKIGVADQDGQIITVDWRAPVATLYYDSNLGKASYQAPEGAICGTLSLKRQYEIEEGTLLSYHDVDSVSNDELLKPFLSAGADSRLKNIVASIQTEQNRIIREDLHKNLIVQGAAGSEPILNVLPFHPKKFAVITTGSEVFKGRIEDKFTPILVGKLAEYGCEMTYHKTCDDDPAGITAAILEAKAAGCELIFTTGGMSVDPDDRTPLAIKNTGAEIITYGAPVLPGAMFLVSYLDGVPVCGLPGCVMYAKRTIFDLLLPRLLADDPITAEDIARLGEGGLCLGCAECHWPNCGFGHC